jgi:hypothetical protein
MYQEPSSTPSTHSDPANQSARAHLNAAEFAQLDAILDGMRLRREATPTWEFGEGFMEALICLWLWQEVQEELRIAINSVAGYAVSTVARGQFDSRIQERSRQSGYNGYSCTGNHWRYK